MAAVIVLPLGFFSTDAGIFAFNAFSVKNIANGAQIGLPVLEIGVIALISAFMAFIAIFLYKKRSVQKRICIFNAVVIACFYLLFFIFVYFIRTKYSANYSISYAVVMPLIALVFDWLASRAIDKDEELIRSVDRIR